LRSNPNSNADSHPEPNGDGDTHKYSDRYANSYSNCDSYLYAVGNSNADSVFTRMRFQSRLNAGFLAVARL